MLELKLETFARAIVILQIETLSMIPPSQDVLRNKWIPRTRNHCTDLSLGKVSPYALLTDFDGKLIHLS